MKCIHGREALDYCHSCVHHGHFIPPLLLPQPVCVHKTPLNQTCEYCRVRKEYTLKLALMFIDRWIDEDWNGVLRDKMKNQMTNLRNDIKSVLNK